MSPTLFRLIGQHRLHDCLLQLDDRPLVGASLFPLFDHAGTVRALMLTRKTSDEILLGEWRPALVEERWFRPLRLRWRMEDLAASADDLGLDGLWHYDPWWELGEQRYREHPAAPALKETNLPGYDDSLTRLWFDGELSRVAFVAIGSGETMRVERFAASRLQVAHEKRRQAAAERGEPRQRARSEWRLRPFWA